MGKNYKSNLVHSSDEDSNGNVEKLRRSLSRSKKGSASELNQSRASKNGKKAEWIDVDLRSPGVVDDYLVTHVNQTHDALVRNIILEA